MVHSRWQSAADRQSIEICGINFTIDPDLQAKSALVRVLQRAVADAMNLVASVGQPSCKKSTDEPLGTRDPNAHAGALCATNEYRRPGLLSKRSATESMALNIAFDLSIV